MKLYTSTPSGNGIGLNVLLTGRTVEHAGKLCSVEVSLPVGCDAIIERAVAPLPKTAHGHALLWTDPADLCDDDGSFMNHAALRDAIRLVVDVHGVIDRAFGSREGATP